jgi:hypothetical protein
MNVVYCSAKLAKLLGVKSKIDPATNAGQTILGNWSAHLFYFAGRKFIQFMNKKSIYSVTICDYKKTDILALKYLFLKSLSAQCKLDGILITEQMLRQHFSDLAFSTTDNDKPAIGSLNDIIYHARASLKHGPPAYNIIENDIVVFNMNKIPYANIGYKLPFEIFAALLNGA